MYNALPLHLASHHIIATTSLALFQTTPHSTSHHLTHFISHQHISRHTIPLYNTIFEKSHHIGHIMHRRTTDGSHCTPVHIADVPHNATVHVLHATSVSDHTIYWPHHLCIAPSHLAPHFTYSPSCIIPPHRTVITPNSTSHYHVSHNIPHHRSVHHHFYIPPLSTSRITPPPLPGIAPCRPTLYLVPHRTTFHIPCHSTRTNPHYTTTFQTPF